MTIGFLHDLKSADQLYSSLGLELNIAPYLLEKDYWIMHCLLESNLDNVPKLPRLILGSMA